jgi:hypothetical protein
MVRLLPSPIGVRKIGQSHVQGAMIMYGRRFTVMANGLFFGQARRSFKRSTYNS